MVRGSRPRGQRSPPAPVQVPEVLLIGVRAVGGSNRGRTDPDALGPADVRPHGQPRVGGVPAQPAPRDRPQLAVRKPSVAWHWPLLTSHGRALFRSGTRHSVRGTSRADPTGFLSSGGSV